MFRKNYCLFCYPEKRRSHFFTYIQGCMEAFIELLPTNKFHLYCYKFINNASYNFSKIFFYFYEKIGLVAYETKLSHGSVKNRSYIFYTEAKKRGLEISTVLLLGMQTGYYRVKISDKYYIYKNIPTFIWDRSNIFFDTKTFTRKYLMLHDLPCPQGASFFSAQKAVDFGDNIGFPLVVKPSNGSLSQHVSCNINTREELKKAIKLSQLYSPIVVVERFVAGNLFRVTVIGKKNVYVTRRERANVIGDGLNTISNLIQTKNVKENRGAMNDDNHTLKKIDLADATVFIDKKNLNPHSIVPKGEKVYLSNKYTTGSGCDLFTESQHLSKENKELFMSIACDLETDLVGIDCIGLDLSLSYKEQDFVILEFNSLPFVDMHTYSNQGVADDVASETWDLVLSKLK